jgi:hypothetical protein
MNGDDHHVPVGVLVVLVVVQMHMMRPVSFCHLSFLG